MKPMSDRKMDMRRGEPDSDGFFPKEAEMRSLPPVGDVKGFEYPDTDERVHKDQQEAIRDTSKNLPKPGYRY